MSSGLDVRPQPFSAVTRITPPRAVSHPVARPTATPAFAHVRDTSRHLPNKRYAEVDYRAARLPAPRKGQHYVRDDNTGDIILAVIATGVIVSILSN